MKRAIASSLLVLFLFNSCGYYLLFLVLKHDIKLEMTGILSRGEGEQVTLRIHKDDARLVWVDKNEFDYHGKRYDVAKIQEKDDYLIIECIEDTLETDLIAGLERYLKKQHSHDSKTKTKTKQVLKKITSLYVTLRHAEVAPDKHAETNQYCLVRNRFQRVYLPVSVPPPDVQFNKRT